jgi:hypothetical protein
MWFFAALPLLLATSADAVVREFDRMIAKQLWPGFDARSTPIAIYDGTQTHFYRHPRIREPYPGQHPGVRANTSADIEGIPTATLLLGGRPAEEAAAILAHEAFHVFQRERYPKWRTNEAALFTYPQDDAELLALARLESEALRRALAGAKTTACWASRALALRRERFGRMTDNAVAYERGTELNEGTARYLQSLAAGRTGGSIPEGGYTQNAVRGRAYATGEAWALILDRLQPDWKTRIVLSLDELVTAAPDAACDFTDAEKKQVRLWARSEADRVADRQLAIRSDFFARSGWIVTVVAPEQEPLRLGSFDPMNVQMVSPKEIVHTRFLQLMHPSGVLEALNRHSLTFAAGAHPLFAGVREWTVTGLPAEPQFTTTEGELNMSAPGFTLKFRRARVERSNQTITVRLQ